MENNREIRISVDWKINIGVQQLPTVQKRKNKKKMDEWKIPRNNFEQVFKTEEH